MISRNKKRLHRKKRSKAKNFGTASIPRVSVFRSNKKLFVQFIDDENGRTLASLDSAKIEGKKFDVTVAEEAGKKISQEALKKKIKKVVFDKSGYRYHGKVKALAEGMRKQGLEF
jgi:large subunit ribosomal protein L18